ncbi:MAG: polysaccharide deacetylase family protein [Chitinophagaceae bacterium]|nr:MAG: polysaccharide deacetylase family protein [Chitinophagaceae bacterium]
MQGNDMDHRLTAPDHLFSYHYREKNPSKIEAMTIHVINCQYIRRCVRTVANDIFLVTVFLLIAVDGFAQQLSAYVSNHGLRKEVPVLCFHHIGKNVTRPNELMISTESFRADMKMLYDSGYHSISPTQLFDFYKTGKPLPPKPFLLTFDDGNADQWENSIDVLDDYNFKALFFIMTVTVGKTNYLTEDQIRLLTQWEHFIGCHTWDHQDVKSLKAKDFHWQLQKPKDYLESLTGLPVIAFAYPYGEWNEKIIPNLRKYGIKMAFQLNGPSSNRFPLHTIRRLMVSGKWSPHTLLEKINDTFEMDDPFQFLNPELH